MDFKCPCCKREIELEKDVGVYMCVCGEGFVIEKGGVGEYD